MCVDRPGGLAGRDGAELGFGSARHNRSATVFDSIVMTYQAVKPTGRGRGNWRRRWKRVGPERRQAAAAALGDVLRRRRIRGLTPLFLLLSVVGHVPLLWALRVVPQKTDIEALARENTYLKKVMQKERAKEVSRDVKDRLTMPPPPPDPQAIVEGTLAADITTDIERVIGNMLDVDVTSKLTARVAGDLRAELVEAAKTIADGKLTAKEIKDIQEQFKRKAHRRTVKALREHREKTQVAHAKLSVKEWYEGRISGPLRKQLHDLLLGGSWGHIWWYHYSGAWAFLGDRYTRQVGLLGAIAEGKHYPPHSGIGGRPAGGYCYLPDWPSPTVDQARALLTVLRQTIYERHPRGVSGPWSAAVRRQVADYFPHRRDEMAKQQVAKMEALWQQVFRQGEEYLRQAEGGTTGRPLAAAQQACFQTLKALHAEARKLVVVHDLARQYAVVNQAVRSRVLRGPAREATYQRLVDALVKDLAPAIRDLGENEFQEGILIRQEGIDRTTKEFAEEMVSLLRRDVKRTLPKPQFDEVVFHSYNRNSYRSKVTGKSSPPGEDDIRRDEAACAKVLAAWDDSRKGYPQKRAEVIAEEFGKAIDRVTKELMSRFLEDGRLPRTFYARAQSVDYTDRVQQRLYARARALAGRGQDLARLTDEGVPDNSAPAIALMLGASRGHGASLEPTVAQMVPAHVVGTRPGSALRPFPPQLPPMPISWGRVTQPEVAPPFECFLCEGIPFLANFPRLDGDLNDWGRIRPLVTQRIRWMPGPGEPIMIYAAWNYQGFFFGYHVTQPAVKYAYPKLWYQYKEKTGVIPQRAPSYGWAYTGDYLRLMFDTLDARGERRGEPHTQEFVIFPRGTEMHPDIPGVERIISATRDVNRRLWQWGEIKAEMRIFPPQAPPETGPDGTGPYRVTRFTATGYTTEIFLPRTCFNVPVFAPGWYIGFEAVVAVQRQQRTYARIWANRIWNGHGILGDKDYPKDWGDLLLLGTDPRLAVQDADERGSLSTGIVPGCSYLLTVVDPDRNVHLSAEDTLVVSAEAVGAADAGGGADLNDVEVYILKETGRNTSVFRGYVSTQPGCGRQVQGVLELMPGQQVRIGYVDLANARGERNVIYPLKLPVLAGISNVVAAAR